MSIRRTYEPLKFLGRLFFVPLRVERDHAHLTHTVPVLTVATTWEPDGEHRWGPTVVLRLPFGYALGVGIWLDSNIDDLGEEFAAHVAHEIEEADFASYVAVNGPVPRGEWNSARKHIAAQGMDPDDEMEIMQSLGIFAGEE